MGSKKSALEALIDFPQSGASDERRELMRENTDLMIAAADRYGARHMEYFDLMFTRVATQIEHNLCRALAMALAKSEKPKELVKRVLSGHDSALSQITRRSAIQTLPDLVNHIRERSTSAYNAPMREWSPEDTLSDANRYTLPKLLLEELYRFIYFSQRSHIAAQVNQETLTMLDRTATRFRHKVIEDAQTMVRDDIIHARKTVNERVRHNKLSEDYIAELLETNQTTEYLIALSAFLDVDIMTTQRILNDMSWDTLALASRAQKMSRSLFSKLVNGMHRRGSDNATSKRIINLYNKISEEAAERVMRFVQVRALAMKDIQPDAAQILLEHRHATKRPVETKEDTKGSFAKKTATA